MKIGMLIADTETTGLDYTNGCVPWEVGWVAAVHHLEDHLIECFTPQQWMLHLTDEQIAAGSPEGMKVGGFYDRYKRPAFEQNAAMKQALIDDCIKVAMETQGYPQFGGANPSFDMHMLIMAGHFTYAQWGRNFQHRLLDIQGLAAGRQRTNMRGLNRVAEMFEIEQHAAHEALDDAITTIRCYAAIYDARIVGLNTEPIRVIDGSTVMDNKVDVDDDW